MSESTAREVWRAVLGNLQLQLPRPTFETWLKLTEGVAYDDHVFVVEAPNSFAVEWLERRIYNALQKTLHKVSGREFELQLKVRSEGDFYAVEQAPAAPSQVVSATPTAPLLFEMRSFNPKYSFESFVPGPSNRLALSASRAVAESPGQTYNPLFLHSGAGLGKTHLLQAIGKTCASRGMSVLYVTSEQFTNEFITAIRNRTTEDFRRRYRSVQVLLIDDVQFLSGKEQTHEGFFHTFNDLHNSGNQVVISSDRPPRELSSIEDRLRSRFEWGLIADIQPPDLETRMAILADKADQLRIDMEDSVIELIAKRVQRNVRELEGSLNRMVAYSQLMNVNITLESTLQILNEMAPETADRTIDPQRIFEQVAVFYALSVGDLMAKNRTKKVALARQIAMYLLIYELELSPTQVGRLLGGRDHSTVIHGAGRITGEVAENGQIRQDILAIKEAIFA
ncbi:MAG: chromosomal replication initiator protein DnaA [Chloroflexi bacterium]|jgi:chromosomal replication initiator protein|nr:chromosomal replication initiator protein DnaA [Chloroflexota bacterium]MDP6496854.1 chromosomal replication initiator protein DnaA [Dehalococcoidia bacterium]MQG54570.1 chromosomal replication initiator protein DnaA [SAR202 cluster bacterium]|tara:strand:- start:14459 stop:15814 length:1356 start_codon:yes stop_codon:yes gene_type:complete